MESEEELDVVEILKKRFGEWETEFYVRYEDDYTEWLTFSQMMVDQDLFQKIVEFEKKKKVLKPAGNPIQKNLAINIEPELPEPTHQLELFQKGIVLIPNFLNPKQQRLLYDSIMKMHSIIPPDSIQSPSKTKENNSKFMNLFCLDLINDPRTIPPEWSEYADKAFKCASSVCNQIPPQFSVSYANCLSYGGDGKLRAHVDQVEGWVFLVSLGCKGCLNQRVKHSIALFHVQGNQMESRKDFEFSSGDVLIFNGSTEDNVVHGIDQILPNTSPDNLPELSDERIGLQFRYLTFAKKHTVRKLHLKQTYNQKK